VIMMLHNAMNADELALIVGQLTTDVSRMRAAGPLSVHDVQQVANALTRAQLLLNALEREEPGSQGVGRETAERLVELEKGIRHLRDMIYQELQCRRPPAGAGIGRRDRSEPGKDNAGGHDPLGR